MGPHVVGLVTYRIQNRFVLFEQRLVAAHPNGQVAAAGSSGTAADRSVQNVDAPSRENLMKPAYGRRGTGAQVEVGISRTETLQQPVLP